MTTYTLQRIPYKTEPEREFICFYKGTVQPRRAVMFLHGHKSSGWTSLHRRATPLADEGMLVILPTLLGYAGIQGELSDYGGPRTISDLTEVAEYARQSLDLETLGLWGISRGGMAAALLAARHPDWFDAVVLQSGIYDFKAFYDNTLPEIVATIEKEAAPLNEAAFTVRSSLVGIGQVQPPLLVLHGTQDERVPVEQAHRLEEALERSAKTNYQVELIEGGHSISRQTLGTTLAFLREHILTANHT